MISSLSHNLKALQKLSDEAKDLCFGSFVQVLESPPTPLEFYRLVSSNRPVLIKNAAKSWPAFKCWNIKYLREVMGTKNVTVAVTPNGYADAVLDDKYFVQPHEKHQSFNETLDTLKANVIDNQFAASPVSASSRHLIPPDQRNLYVDDSDPPVLKSMNSTGNGVHYVQLQNGNLMSEFRDLLETGDVPYDIDFATEALGYPPDAVNLWIGESTSITSLHKDNYENLYVVISGSKTFTLYPPTECHTLYEQSYTPAVYEPIETSFTDGNAKIAKPQLFKVTPQLDSPSTPWIPIDPLHPDSDKYLLNERSKKLTVTVNAGDMLYLPSMWFHHVTQSEPPIASLLSDCLPDKSFQNITSEEMNQNKENVSKHLESKLPFVVAVNYWYDMQFDWKYAYFNFMKAIGDNVRNSLEARKY
ncbi:cupin-like domain-containing protein [Paraphysoderma sedebokerense]|nr:cupin-like domain-containing protein [Paraphysoderma sedebokerense]